MPELLNYSTWFLLGTLFEAFLLLSLRIRPVRALAVFALILPFCALVWFFVRDQYQLYSLFFVISFSLYFCFRFNKEVLPEITELTLLQFMLVFVYVLYAAGLHNFPLPFLVALSVPCLWTLVLAFIRSPLGRFGRLLSYLWFIGMVLTVLIIQCMTWLYPRLVGFVAFENPLEAVVAGMTFLSFMLYASYVANLVVINRYENLLMKEYLMYRYQHHDLTARQALVITLVQGGLLAANAIAHLVPDAVIIGVSLSLSPLIMHIPWFRSQQIPLR